MDFSQIFKKLTAKHCAFIGIFFWATAFVITKLVLKEVDAMSLGVLRYFFASIIVKITIETPKKLTDKQKELLQKFEESLNDKNYEQKSGFMKKVKKFFKDIID